MDCRLWMTRQLLRPILMVEFLCIEKGRIWGTIKPSFPYDYLFSCNSIWTIFSYCMVGQWIPLALLDFRLEFTIDILHLLNVDQVCILSQSRTLSCNLFIVTNRTSLANNQRKTSKSRVWNVVFSYCTFFVVTLSNNFAKIATSCDEQFLGKLWTYWRMHFFKCIACRNVSEPTLNISRVGMWNHRSTSMFGC